MAKRRPSGDGMVRKREDGRWEGRIVVGHKEQRRLHLPLLIAGTSEGADWQNSTGTSRSTGTWICGRRAECPWASGWIAGWRSTPPPRCGPPPWRAIGDTSSGTSSPAWGQAGGQDHSGGYPTAVPGAQEHGRRRSTRNTGTSWPAPRSAASTACLHEALDAAAQENLIARNPTDGIILPRKKLRPSRS